MSEFSSSVSFPDDSLNSTLITDAMKLLEEQRCRPRAKLVNQSINIIRKKSVHVSIPIPVEFLQNINKIVGLPVKNETALAENQSFKSTLMTGSK